MSIRTFNDKETMKSIREQSLNAAITVVNDLDPKVKGLQTVVALSMTQPVVNVNEKKITFKQGGPSGTTQELDLGPMFDSYQHGIGVSGATGGTIPGVEKIKFKNLSVVDTGNKSVEITAPEVTGQVGSTNAKTITRLNIEGNTAGSSLDANGVMTLNMPNNSIKSSVNGDGLSNVDKVRVIDTSKASRIENDTLFIQIPDPIQGELKGSTPKTIKSLKFEGPVGTSTDTDGNFVIDLPFLKGEVNSVSPGEEFIKGVKVVGNVGNSKVENEYLTIDLPVGGGGGGTTNPLKVGVTGNLVPNVEEIHFSDSEVKVDITTRTSNKVLITHKGTPIKLDDGTSTPSFEYVKQVNIKGDIEGSSISSTGVLDLLIPKHAGLTVSDDTTTTAGVTSLKFANAKISTDSTSTPVTTVTINGISGQMEGDSGFKAVEKIKLKGTLGGSSISDGLLTIDLPAGGGGTGPGSDITGIVGSQSGKIDRIEVIGSNTYNSGIAGSTLKIDIPRKPAIRGGAAQYSDVDIVEVANSTVTLDSAGGQRKALITPHIPYMFFGWFPDMATLNASIPEQGRIPTKTCGYVLDSVTKQNTLMMWMMDPGGTPMWEAIEGAGTLTLMNGASKVGHVDSVIQNPMISVDSSGRMTVKDTTIPEIPVLILNETGGSVAGGVASKLKFEDGASVSDLSTGSKELTIHRAQRRLEMQGNPETTFPYLGNSDYEGSIFFNKSDASWWGYHNKDAGPGEKKWSKIIHDNMSSQVNSLDIRLPKEIEIISVNSASADSTHWQESGWTYLAKESKAVPPELKDKSGGYIQTFVHEEVVGSKYRTQMFYADIDAAVYKRNLDASSTTWPSWSKVSFNEAELKAHNEDPGAHHKTHPFYKTVTFDCKYTEWTKQEGYLPIPAMNLLGSSNGKQGMNDDQIATVPYKGNFRIRGRLYFRGITAKPAELDYGFWYLTLYKRAKNGPWAEVKKVEYDHKTTSMVYPPLRWDIQNIPLEAGDEVQLKLRFQPKNPGDVDRWLATHPDIGFYGLRSFVSIDEQGNDGGYALGETHRKLHGKFASIGDAGVKVFKDNPFNTDVRVVGESVTQTSTEMQE